jgi:methylmalonyl-CoA/ethylmalonyl-CoA epimerase
MAKSEIWQIIQKKWPAMLKGQRVSYFDLADKLSSFIENKSIIIVSVSHFGVVVEDIEASCASLDCVLPGLFMPITKVRVEPYKVYVSRFNVNNIEIEFIEPYGKSFFEDHLKEHGQTLQHISFSVTNIEKSLQLLKSNHVELIDEIPRKGAHGKVAFANPQEFRPYYLELCEIDAGA